MRKLYACILFVLAVTFLLGSSYTITNTFSGGTTAVASQVNANFSAAKTAIDDNDARIDALLTTDTCTSPPCDLTSGTTIGGAAVQTGTDDDVPESGDFAAAVDLEADGSVSANAVALGTDTTGNYAGSSSEGGAATTATALAANGGNCSAGSFPIGVDASGAAESCTDAVIPAELSAYTTGTSTPTDGSTACNTGDMHLETDAFKIYFCVDGTTDDWYGVAITDTP